MWITNHHSYISGDWNLNTMGTHRHFSTTTHTQWAALLLLPSPLFCLWLKGLSPRSRCFASVIFGSRLHRFASTPAPTRATLWLSSPARTLDLVYPSYISCTRSRPVALFQLPSAPLAGTLLPGGSSPLPRLPRWPPWLCSVMVLHCLLDRCQRLGLE